MLQVLPTFDDVLAAAARLEGVAHKTPVMQSSSLNEQLQAKIYVKCENFQRMGAFKFRGGFNALAKLNETQRRAGVVAYSSGNHAQAVATVPRSSVTTDILRMPVLWPQPWPTRMVSLLSPPLIMLMSYLVKVRRLWNCSRKWANSMCCLFVWAAAGF
jgi:hypothetical protein